MCMRECPRRRQQQERYCEQQTNRHRGIGVLLGLHLSSSDERAKDMGSRAAEQVFGGRTGALSYRFPVRCRQMMSAGALRNLLVRMYPGDRARAIVT